MPKTSVLGTIIPPGLPQAESGVIGLQCIGVLTHLLWIESLLLYGWGKLVCRCCIVLIRKLWWLLDVIISQMSCVGFCTIPYESDTYYWWGTPISALCGYACTSVYVYEASNYWISLSYYLGSHMFALIPTRMYPRYFNRWDGRLFHVWITHSTWRQYLLGS